MHLAYKPAPAVDLDTGAVLRLSCIPRIRVTPRQCRERWARAAEHLAAVDAAPTPEARADVIADRGYHSRDALKTLDGGLWKSRVSEPKRDELSRWHGDDQARRVVYSNRARLLSGAARQAFKLRAELGRTQLRADPG